MFGVQPRQGRISGEGSGPLEALVRLQLHAKKRIWQAGEIVVVDTGIDEGSG